MTSGSSEASSAPPNTISRMASAASDADPDGLPRPVRSELVMDGPPRETWTSGPSADLAPR